MRSESKQPSRVPVAGYHARVAQPSDVTRRFEPKLPMRTSGPIARFLIGLVVWCALVAGIPLAEYPQVAFILVTLVVFIALLALPGLILLRPTTFDTDGVLLRWPSRSVLYREIGSVRLHRSDCVRATLRDGTTMDFSISGVRAGQRTQMIGWLRERVDTSVFG